MTIDDALPKGLELYLIKLIGVYLFGSASYNVYATGRGDMDVQAVVKKGLSHIETRYHQAAQSPKVTCRARKFGAVVYTVENINRASRHPQFDLNFDTGRYESYHMSLNPAQESSKWFLFEALYGLEPVEVFVPVSRLRVLEAIANSLEWHKANELVSDNSVLNA